MVMYFELRKNGKIKEIDDKQYQKSKELCLFFNNFINECIIVDGRKGFYKEGSPKKMIYLGK